MRPLDGVLGPLRSDERGVSPVIGVVLMVAITVILAATAAGFLVTTADADREDVPSVRLDFTFDSGADEVEIRVEAGDTVEDGNRLTTTVSSGTLSGSDWASTFGGSDVGAGDSVTLTHGSDWSGETVRVVWEGPKGDTTIVADDEAPEE